MSDGVYFVVVILMAVLFGLLCSSIAKSKNRDPLAYFLLGFLLGIFGLIIAAIVPKKEIKQRYAPPYQPPGAVQPPPPSTQWQSRASTCPQCGFQVNPDAQICPNCGLILKGLAGRVEAPLTEPEVCPSCGMSVLRGANWCGFCGSPLGKADSAATSMRRATIKRDITIGGEKAFFAGEIVEIEKVSPDQKRPEYKYVVMSKNLNRRFRLSDNDISF